MSVLAIIPARGGSQGIRHKNLSKLYGHPLISWTIKAAREACLVTRVIVSTDDLEIASVAKKYGAEVPFIRPSELGTDTADAASVAKHACEWMVSHGYKFDMFCYLQPTSPLRRSEDIDAAITKMAGADTVVSVFRVPHNLLPNSLMVNCDKGQIEFKAADHLRQFRRQDKADCYYARNGPAILVSRIAQITSGKGLYGNRIVPYEMPFYRSFDIDEQEDLEFMRKVFSP